jgi:predicted RNA-binding protein with PUA domain
MESQINQNQVKRTSVLSRLFKRKSAEDVAQDARKKEISLRAKTMVMPTFDAEAFEVIVKQRITAARSYDGLKDAWRKFMKESRVLDKVNVGLEDAEIRLQAMIDVCARNKWLTFDDWEKQGVPYVEIAKNLKEKYESQFDLRRMLEAKQNG